MTPVAIQTSELCVCGQKRNQFNNQRRQQLKDKSMELLAKLHGSAKMSSAERAFLALDFAKTQMEMFGLEDTTRRSACLQSATKHVEEAIECGCGLDKCFQALCKTLRAHIAIFNGDVTFIQEEDLLDIVNEHFGSLRNPQNDMRRGSHLHELHQALCSAFSSLVAVHIRNGEIEHAEAVLRSV